MHEYSGADSIGYEGHVPPLLQMAGHGAPYIQGGPKK